MSLHFSSIHKINHCKWVLLVFAVLLIFAVYGLFQSDVAYGEGNEAEETILDELKSSTINAINTLDLDIFEEFLRTLDSDQQALLPFSDLKEFIKELKTLIDKYLKKHDSITEQELYEKMGFPENWRKITRYRKQ